MTDARLALAEMKSVGQTAWHQLQTEEVVRLLDVDLEKGLSTAEARRRLEKFGRNELSIRRRESALRRFLLQFNQPLVYILLVASVVTLFLHGYVDAAVIFGVVFINAIVGYVQETKAESAIEALSRMVSTMAMTRRDGKQREVPSSELVPGDVVLLQSGDRVPADLRLYWVRSLQVDESSLTGESVPVHKHANVLDLDTILAERKNLAFAGTSVTYGRAEGVVWATGNRTETGQIAALISEAIILSTPLTRKIAQFSRLLLWAILVVAGFTFAVGLARGEAPVEMFMAAVALAVGAIPEGLPAAVTITLAIGVSRLAKRRAIVRKLPAVETLGSTTVICSDKTGTLTENAMTVQEIFADGNWYHVTGSGYSPQGEILSNNMPVDVSEHAALAECLKAGLLCNDSQLIYEDGRFSVQGDPTEVALIVAAEKGGLVEAEIAGCHPRVDVIPFESEHQFMATLHGISGRAARVIYKKGAVERLLDRCSAALDDRGNTVPLLANRIRQAAEHMAARGLRVLAFACREAESEQTTLHPHHVAGGLTFLGLQGMIDPPRPETIDAVARCRRAGIQVKMITGDHALTAKSIAMQIGLQSGEGKLEPLAVTGSHLGKVDDAEFEHLAESASVFARVAPEQKFRLVKALQAHGHVVAMTGDGVNDAPALRQADIGIAMGITGTDVAKSAADMLLTDDNFASIEAAVEEGRGVFDNLTKFLVWTLPTNGGEGLTILAAIIAGITLPILPVQLLWINMATAILLGLTLVFEPKERNLMHRPPRDPKQPILTYPLIMRTGLVTLITAAGAIGLFFWEQQQLGASVAEARTVVVNVIVMAELFYLWNCRSLERSIFTVGWFSNWWLLGGCALMISSQLLLTYVPVMNRLFHTAPIGLRSWSHVLIVASAVSLAVGFEKWVRNRKRWSHI